MRPSGDFIARAVAGLGAIAVAAMLLSPTAPAQAQSCQVKPAQGVVFQVGGVLEFGDLKIRSNSYAYEQTNVDLKAPGFGPVNTTLHKDQPQKFNICGEEVTVTLGYANTLTVGVF